MKKTLFLALFSASILAQGQSLSVGIGGGYGTKKSPVIDLRVKVEADSYVMQFGFAANTTQRVNAGTIFYAGIGYDIKAGTRLTFNPIIGYQHTLCSNDRPEFNTTGYLAGLTVSRYMWDGGSLYLFAANTSKQTIFTVGISAEF